MGVAENRLRSNNVVGWRVIVTTEWCGEWVIIQHASRDNVKKRSFASPYLLPVFFSFFFPSLLHYLRYLILFLLFFSLPASLLAVMISPSLLPLSSSFILNHSLSPLSSSLLYFSCQGCQINHGFIFAPFWAIAKKKNPWLTISTLIIYMKAVVEWIR